VVSTVKFKPVNFETAGIEVCKCYGLRSDSGNPLYLTMGCHNLIDNASFFGGLYYRGDAIGDWLYGVMRWAIEHQGEPKTIGGEVAILRLDGRGEQWIRQPEVCKEVKEA
jgi:hypothetical protein